MQRSQETPEQGAARRIKERREALGLSQAVLAYQLKERTGLALDPSSITRLERGERGIRIDELVAFATALGVAVSDLLVTEADRALKEDVLRLVTLWSDADRRRGELRADLLDVLERVAASGDTGDRWTGRYADALVQAMQIRKQD